MSEHEFEFAKDATFGEILGPVVEIAKAGNREMAAEYIRAYRKHLVEHWDKTPEEANKTIAANVGYWGGYYGSDVRRAIEDVFGAMHPIFGPVSR